MPETIGYSRPNKIRKTLSKEMEQKLQSAVDRLERGRAFRQSAREDTWRETVRMYLGDTKWASYNSEDPTADLVNINISFSTVNTIVPFVSDEDPSFMVEPDSEDADVESAQVLATFMNRIWRSHEVQGSIAMGDATFDQLVLGDGYLQVGYEVVNHPTYDETGNVVGEGRVKVAEFSIDRVSPWDVWLDPYSDGLHNARWVCKRMLVPVDELKNDSRYKLSPDDEWDGSDLGQRDLSPEDQERVDYLVDGWAAVYEFYDIKEGWMITFVGDGTQAIRYIEQIKCPIVQIPNYRIPNSPYHMSDLEQIRSLQDEINKTRSQMMTHRRRNVMKWIVNEARLSEDAMEAMKSSKINDVIKVETNEPINNIIQAVVPQPLQPDIYAMDDRLRADVNEITGVNEYLRGIPQNISRTATEASIIEGATNTRTRHKLLQIELAARQAGQMLLDIIRDVLPLTEFKEMTMFVTGRDAERLNRATNGNPQAGPVLLTPNPEVFKGRYRVEVERGSTELRNPQMRAQQMLQMVQIMAGLAPLLMQQQISFNFKALLEDWFEAEGIKDVERYFEVDQNQQELMNLALQQARNEAAGVPGGGGGAATALPGGGTGGAGVPNRGTARPPREIPTPANSGMLPGRQY